MSVALLVLGGGGRLRFDSDPDGGGGVSTPIPSDTQTSIDWSNIVPVLLVIAFGLFMAFRAVRSGSAPARQQRVSTEPPIARADPKSGIDVVMASRWLAVGAAMFILASQMDLLSYNPFMLVRQPFETLRPTLRLSYEPLRPQMFFLPIGALICSIVGGLTRSPRLVSVGAGLLAAPTILVLAMVVGLVSGLSIGSLPIPLADLGAGFYVAVLASAVSASLSVWLVSSVRRHSALVTTSPMWCSAAAVAVLVGGSVQVLRGFQESVPYGAETGVTLIVAFSIWMIAASAAWSSTSDGMAFAGAIIAAPLFYSAYVLVIDNFIGVSLLLSSTDEKVATAAFGVGLIAVIGSQRPWTSMDDLRDLRARFALPDEWDDDPDDDRTSIGP